MATDFEEAQGYIGLLREAMEEWFSKPREGYHVSDITLCPRRQIFKEIDPVPLTDKDLNMYSSGKAVHQAVQMLFMSYKGRFEKEKHIEHEDIQGSTDIYDKKKNIPIEFKTSRSDHIDRPKIFHIEQLRYYMAMLNAPIGYLIYQCLMHFQNKPYKEFKITMTEEQRKGQLTKLNQRDKFSESLKTAKDPSLARHVYFDTELRWLCRDCPYAQTCEKMRNKTEYNLGNGNGGRNHSTA